jgi:hypothetical protein
MLNPSPLRGEGGATRSVGGEGNRRANLGGAAPQRPASVVS